ncbi:DNA mismatch repair protein MutT [Jeotgalibacillus malaysiensis]|uniref:DNA mismatch repair protein MutT n=1 Tax=Jeotgalibacillus malaysiensis TaxID=1508404 RepID=A0A0B5AKP7_9BACL|nr:NUDIX hydrolase [Jeotgalibacillus malaysiensis]AJD90621.1 DNA mismatch repair protein MutT [Jeotgalibacillus malaysiensis]
MSYVRNLREKIGHDPVNLVGVTALAFNESGNILLQQRPDGVWGLPGGLIELGESTEQAVRREVKEETGIEVGSLELITVLSGEDYHVKLPNGDEFFAITVVYYTKDVTGEPEADGIETIETDFFPPNELPEGTSPRIKKMLRDSADQLSDFGKKEQ